MRIIRRPLMRCIAAAMPLVALWACHPAADDVEPTDRAEMIEEGTLEGRIVEFALEPGAASPEDIERVARRVETLADVHSARVKVRAAEDDATVVSVELWGSNFPDEDTIASQMRASFPFMKDAVITVAELGDTGAPARLEDAAREEEAPEVLEQRIIDDLRAKGVEGDIEIDVTDDADGHREVEVRVESDDPNDALAVE